MSYSYPIHRTPEQGHTKRCLAKALIAAIENLRDDSGSDVDFRIAVQDNVPLEWADSYLTEGVTECLCPVPEGLTVTAVCSRDQSWWAQSERGDTCRSCGRPVSEHSDTAPALTPDTAPVGTAVHGVNGSGHREGATGRVVAWAADVMGADVVTVTWNGSGSDRFPAEPGRGVAVSCDFGTHSPRAVAIGRTYSGIPACDRCVTVHSLKVSRFPIAGV